MPNHSTLPRRKLNVGGIDIIRGAPQPVLTKPITGYIISCSKIATIKHPNDCNILVLSVFFPLVRLGKNRLVANNSAKLLKGFVTPIAAFDGNDLINHAI